MLSALYTPLVDSSKLAAGKIGDSPIAKEIYVEFSWE